MAKADDIGSAKNPLEMTINKRFFVSMLTRDIELEDAILDLLDNCLDGAVRTSKPSGKTKKPYHGFWAKITINQNRFEIFDNCGGIPQNLIRTAFAIGRNPAADEHHKTIGVYGIGMKRAIFKMALEATVESNSSFGFEVDIDEKWLTQDHNWRLAFRRVQTPFKSGTKISIPSLRPEIKKVFGSTSFVTRLQEFISRHYAVIISKGFRVELNGVAVPAAPVAILSAASNTILKAEDGQPVLAPYMLKYETPKVSASIWVGMYRRPLATEGEEESETEQRQSSDNSGWTIICNDRAIVSNDTTILTGWGDAGVPRFHPQFIGIRGIVVMESEYPLELPLTTTKRGLDASSELFLQLKGYMREGTKTFTNFTNHWKTERGKARELFDEATLMELPKLKQLLETLPFTSVKNLPGAKRFQPNLPTPAPSEMKRISFLRHQAQVARVGRRVLEDAHAKPSDVGAACFDYFLKKGTDQ